MHTLKEDVGHYRGGKPQWLMKTEEIWHTCLSYASKAHG